MPTVSVTAVFAGDPVADLTEGSPVAGAPIEFGGPGRDIVTATTDAHGRAVVEIPPGTVFVTMTANTDDGGLLGDARIELGDDDTELALTVRLQRV